jgi:hypothetical protein
MNPDQEISLCALWFFVLFVTSRSAAGRTSKIKIAENWLALKIYRFLLHAGRQTRYRI